MTNSSIRRNVSDRGGSSRFRLPGTAAAERYLQRVGLLADLETLGFGIVGYGLHRQFGLLAPAMAKAMQARELAKSQFSRSRARPDRTCVSGIAPARGRLCARQRRRSRHRPQCRRDRHPQDLDLRPDDSIEIEAPAEAIPPPPRAILAVRVLPNGVETGRFVATAAIETNLECAILRAGGLLPLILRNAMSHSGIER